MLLTHNNLILFKKNNKKNKNKCSNKKLRIKIAMILLKIFQIIKNFSIMNHLLHHNIMM